MSTETKKRWILKRGGKQLKSNKMVDQEKEKRKETEEQRTMT